MESSKKTSKRTQIKNTKKVYNCTFCINISNEVWSDINNRISCCRGCWNNHPAVARATEGKSFNPNKVICF